MLHTQTPADLQRPGQLDPAERLFRHSRRPEWGVGLWVREEPTRRRLRFKDGTLRTFKRGFYHLLKAVDVDRVDVDAEFESIAGQHELLAMEERAASARLSNPPMMSFPQQIQVFQALYPGGLQGDAYVHAHRRPASPRQTRKSHSELVAERAKEALGRARLGALMDSGSWDLIHEDAVAILAKTSLVSLSATVRPLKALDAEQRAAFAQALGQLLYGEERYGQRFGRWLRALRDDCGMKVRWPLATIFQALLFPKRHVCVRHKVFDMQARSLRPGTAMLRHPTPAGYRRALQVAKATRRALQEAGQPERDFLDVSAFIWETLRPKAKAVLADLDS